MKGLCKEDKGEGRWETAEAFGGYLCSPQSEKHILLYFQSHTPTPSLHTLIYTIQDPDPQTLRVQHGASATTLSHPAFVYLCPRSIAEVKSGLKHGEIILAHCSLLHQSYRARARPIPCTYPGHLSHCCFPQLMVLYKDFGVED